MTAREIENNLLVRCAAAARNPADTAQNQQEANVFRLAAMVVRSRFPMESANLMNAGERYFAQHPDDKLAAVDVVRNGWIFSLPRLRSMLTLQLHR